MVWRKRKKCQCDAHSRVISTVLDVARMTEVWKVTCDGGGDGGVVGMCCLGSITPTLGISPPPPPSSIFQSASTSAQSRFMGVDCWGTEGGNLSLLQ